jgi:GMP synthase (glutamine-hydrolysing)
MTVIKSRCTAMRPPLMAFEGDFALRRRGDKLDLLGADRLAFRAVCPTQASSISNYALGLWFHIEAKPRDPGRWPIGHAVDVAKSGIDPCVLRAR